MSRRRGVRALVALLSVVAAVAVVLSGGCGEGDLVFPGGKTTPTGTTTTTTTTATATPTGTLTATPRPTNPGATPGGTTTPIVVPTVCSKSGGPCSEPLLKCCTGICLPAPLSVCLG